MSELLPTISLFLFYGRIISLYLQECTVKLCPLLGMHLCHEVRDLLRHKLSHTTRSLDLLSVTSSRSSQPSFLERRRMFFDKFLDYMVHSRIAVSVRYAPFLYTVSVEYCKPAFEEVLDRCLALNCLTVLCGMA